MQLPTLIEIEAAQAIVYGVMPPTPQYTWPLLNRRMSERPGVSTTAELRAESPDEVWVKHENHSPVGAFKLRGALVYAAWLKQTQPGLETLVAATRGNHGQGVGMAARLLGLKAIIVVPRGNSREKNLAMQAQGAELVEHGDDFQASLEYARELADKPGHAMVESIHERLVMGTATYALEFFRAAPPLATVYVPIGMGSSICGIAAVRNALGLATEIVGVVASAAPAYAVSFRERRIVAMPALTRLADGLACRQPNPDAMQVIWDNVSRIVEVSEEEIASAMRACYEDTHNLVEGAAAAALAGALQERGRRAENGNEPIGIILTGCNVDREVYAEVLLGQDSGQDKETL
jgi:threonine dehydratase